MPIWAALALVLGAYVFRSATRGFDFTPDLPADVVALVVLLIVVGLVGWVRADDARRNAESAPDSAPDAKDPES